MKRKKRQAAQAAQMSFTTAFTQLHLGTSSKLHKVGYARPMLTACVPFWLQAYREQSVFA